MSERKEISIYDLGNAGIAILEQEIVRLQGKATAHLDIIDQQAREVSDLRAALDVAMHESDQWREQAQQMREERDEARADLGWWRATVANYVTSATVEDRALLRGVLADALTYPHPGAAFMAELGQACKVVAAVRATVGTDPAYKDLVPLLFALRAALSAYDAAREGGGG